MAPTEPAPWQRHLRWVIPLLITAVALVAFEMIARSDLMNSAELSVGGTALIGMLVAVVVAVFAALATLVNGIRTLAGWRRRRRRAAGRFTRTEIAEQQSAHAHEQAWAHARQLRAALVQGQVPPTIQVWDVVPAAGEVFFVDGPATYARFYGQDVTYNQGGGFFFGSPLFVAAGLAATAIGNSARRSQAEAQAAQQWREHQTARVVVSNQRILCLANGQWLSFWYSDMTAVQPSIEQWALFCQFGSTVPLMLVGMPAPAASVIVTLQTHGVEGVAQHPALAALGDRG